MRTFELLQCSSCGEFPKIRMWEHKEQETALFDFTCSCREHEAFPVRFRPWDIEAAVNHWNLKNTENF